MAPIMCSGRYITSSAEATAIIILSIFSPVLNSAIRLFIYQNIYPKHTIITISNGRPISTGISGSLKYSSLNHIRTLIKLKYWRSEKAYSDTQTSVPNFLEVLN